MISLFDNVSPEEPRINSGESQVVDAWKVWCEATKRPRQPTPDAFFAKKYRAARLDRLSHSDILSRVKAAAFLPPRPRDPADVRRATMSLSRNDLYRQGCRLMSSGAKPYMFGDTGGNIDGCSVQDLEEACGVSMELWSLEDHAASDRLIAVCDPETINFAADVARNEFNVPDVLPTHLLLTENLWRNAEVSSVPTVNLNSSRGVIARGRAELEELPSEVLALDVKAKKMYLSGSSVDEVMAYHNKAPKGFWDKVKSLVESGVSIDDAVQRAELRFGWGVNNR